MTTVLLNPYISVFETEEEQRNYDKWAEKKLAASAKDTSEGLPHDEFMARIEAIIVKAESK